MTRPRPSLTVDVADTSRQESLEHATASLFAAVWLFAVTPASGGFHDWRTALGLAAAVPVLLATRFWRHVPRSLLTLAVAVPLGGLVVLMVTPTGWAQADSVAAHTAGAIAAVVTVAYARSERRRNAVLGVLAACLIVQLTEAWLPWWGSGDPDHLMFGTFYWHNQFAAYVAALGVVAMVLAVSTRGAASLALLLLSGLAAAAVFFSTSRTCLLLITIGWLLSGLLRGHRNGAAALSTWALIPAVTAAAVVVLTSAVFFPQAAEHGSGATSGPAGDRTLASLDSNGHDRIAWSRVALTAWSERPITGNGFDSFLATAPSRLPQSATLSRFVHNGYAEALTSGGLIFGGPVVALCVMAFFWALRGLAVAVRKSCPNPVAVGGTALATGLLLAHSAVDFDWHYATLVVTLGVVAGVCYRAQTSPHVEPSRYTPLYVTGILVAVAIGIVGSLVEHHGRTQLEIRTGGNEAAVARLLSAQVPGTYDPRLALAALRLSYQMNPDGSAKLTVRKSLARSAVQATGRYAEVDDMTARERARVQALVAQH